MSGYMLRGGDPVLRCGGRDRPRDGTGSGPGHESGPTRQRADTIACRHDSGPALAAAPSRFPIAPTLDSVKVLAYCYSPAAEHGAPGAATAAPLAVAHPLPLFCPGAEWRSPGDAVS